LNTPHEGPPLPSSAAHPARSLSLLDAVGIGVNGIVGSGIYLLVAPLAAAGGGASALGVIACGLLCVLIALCFAELSSMFDRSGGPYIYARAAFGGAIGFGVGWFGMATGILGLAAVAVGFAGALARFIPAAATARVPIAVGLICALGAINCLGVKAGGRTSTLLSIIKIAPLALLALLGLRFVSFNGLHFESGGVVRSAFLAIFMMSGFEYAAVPAGEVRDARRNVPLAIVGSLAFACLLYAALQLVSVGALPDLASREQPLPDVAALLFPHGARIIGVTAVISMAGFCSSVALVAPRYFLALAEDGYLPKALTRISRFQTPGAAIATSTAFASGLAILLGYASLVDVANVVILSGYALTSLACLVLRFKLPGAPRRYRLPFGPLIPLLATCSAVALLISARPRAAEFRFSGVLLLIGFGAWLFTGLARRALTPQQ
jgi:APA family basic amino acid/polyamine antiporter